MVATIEVCVRADEDMPAGHPWVLAWLPDGRRVTFLSVSRAAELGFKGEQGLTLSL